MNIHLMLSVWSKIDKQSALLKAKWSLKVFYIPVTDWIDFSILMQRFYWHNFSSKLLRPYKIDAGGRTYGSENDDLLNRRQPNGKTW